MNIAVRYYTKSGNTAKLAEAIASELGVKAETVDKPLNGHTDILFLGSSVYAAGVSGDVKRFIDALDPKAIGQVVCFSTAALLPSTYAQVSKLLSDKGINVSSDEFHCRGQFHFMHKGKPDADDIKAVKDFAKKVTGKK